MPLPTPRLLTGAALALVLTTVAACSSPTATPGTAASDASVTLYSGRNETLVQPALDAFTEATGIAVEVRYGGTAELAAQLLEEGDRTRAHVFLAQDAGALGAVAKAGQFATLPEATLDLVDDAWSDPDGRWVGVTGRSRVLAYNGSMVSGDALPASVFELTGPEWKGKVGVAPTNASFQSFITAMRVQHGDEKTRDFLEGLAANEPQLREKNGVIVSDIEAGAYPVGLVNHYYLWEAAAEKGVPADQLATKLHFFSDGDTGALINVSGIGLLANQPDADGQALVDYLMSTAGQEYFATKTFEYPLVSGVATAPGLTPLDQLDAPDINLSDLDELEATITMIKEAGLL